MDKTPSTYVTDMLKFGKRQVQAMDPDCEYRIMDVLTRHLPHEDRLWMDLLYVAYTHIPSAYLVYQSCLACGRFQPRLLEHIDDTRITLPTSVERRGLRNKAAMRQHLLDLVRMWEEHCSAESWLTQGFTDNKIANWHKLQQTLQGVKQNGRWAAYKVSELLYANHRDWIPIEPADAAMEGSSGPRQGLSLIFPTVVGNGPGAITELNNQANVLQSYYKGQGLELSIDELETLLCNFHSLAVGRYYVGHDIDLIQQQLYTVIDRHHWAKERLEAVWLARQAALPHWTLGELNGWTGVRTELNTVYRDKGVVDWWTLQGVLGGPTA